MTQRFLSTAQVLERTALSRATIKRRIKAGTFPQPIRLGHRTNVFVENEIDAWIDAKIVLGRPA
jgi:prophage regulatory protein